LAAAVRATATTATTTTTLTTNNERNPPHIAHDVNVVVAFKNFVLMCLLQAASLFFVNPLPSGDFHPMLTLKFKVQICNFSRQVSMKTERCADGKSFLDLRRYTHFPSKDCCEISLL